MAREKLLAEMTVGKTILEGPKPDPKVIDVWLKRPLAYILEKFAGTAIAKVAAAALELLGKLAGLW